jgi:hypothetical protein
MRRQIVRQSSRGWSGRASRTVYEDAKIAFIEPITFGFFLVSQRSDGPCLRPDVPRLVSNGARFSFGQPIVLSCVFAVFLSEAHPGVANSLSQGPRRSTHK